MFPLPVTCLFKKKKIPPQLHCITENVNVLKGKQTRWHKAQIMWSTFDLFFVFVYCAR